MGASAWLTLSTTLVSIPVAKEGHAQAFVEEGLERRIGHRSAAFEEADQARPARTDQTPLADGIGKRGRMKRMTDRAPIQMRLMGMEQDGFFDPFILVVRLLGPGKVEKVRAGTRRTPI